MMPTDRGATVRRGAARRGAGPERSRQRLAAARPEWSAKALLLNARVLAPGSASW